MAKLQCVVILGVVAAAIGTVSAGLSEEDRNAIKADLIPILAECGKEFSITKEDVMSAKKSKDIDGLNPCYFACFLKKKKIIDEEGNYSPEAAKSEHAKFVHDDELVKKLDAAADSCTPVNEEPVSDGAAGCERAKLVIGCLMNHDDVIAIMKE